jgi:hypothetical protein
MYFSWDLVFEDEDVRYYAMSTSAPMDNGFSLTEAENTPTAPVIVWGVTRRPAWLPLDRRGVRKIYCLR